MGNRSDLEKGETALLDTRESSEGPEGRKLEPALSHHRSITEFRNLSKGAPPRQDRGLLPLAGEFFVQQLLIEIELNSQNSSRAYLGRTLANFSSSPGLAPGSSFQLSLHFFLSRFEHS